MDGKRFSIKERPRKLRNVLTIAVIFAVIIIYILYSITDLDHWDTNIDFQQRHELLNEGWRVTVGDLDEEVVLPYYLEAEPNQEILISGKIPKIESDDTVIVIRNYHLNLRVDIEGEEIYRFPKGAQSENTSIVTDDWNRIYLPENREGDTINFRMKTGSAGFSGYLEPALFGEDNSIMAYLQNKYLLPFALGVILIIIGILLIMVSTIYFNTLSERSHLILGVAFISVGLWFVDRSMMPVFMVGSNTKFFAAFTMLSLIPLLIGLYEGERFDEHDQSVINVLIILDCLLVLGIFTVIGAGIAPMHAMVPYVYLGIFINCAYMTYLTWYYAHGKGRMRLNQVQWFSVRLEFLSMVIAVAGATLSLIVDLVLANVEGSARGSWSSVGIIQMISVIVFALLHFVILVYNSYYSALESKDTQKKLHDSQLQLMMGQIQPHFMFNTLSSIRTLIKIDPDEAYNMTYNFSNYLRANVDNLTNLSGISFHDEVEHIQSYINIEKVRFGERLKVEMDIKEDDFVVPPLSIQPLVENAVKHGVCKRPEGGTVWLRSYADAKNYIVEVEDNGVGISPERIAVVLGSAPEDGDNLDQGSLTGNGSENHQSTGMRNITMRLEEMSHATLEVDSTEGVGTLMKVIFPKDAQPETMPEHKSIEEFS